MELFLKFFVLPGDTACVLLYLMLFFFPNVITIGVFLICQPGNKNKDL